MKYMEFRGILFPVYELGYNVYSCADAATAKGISTSEELKTLVLRASNGLFYALHIPGDKRANFKAIKRKLNVHDIFLADKVEDLKKLGTMHGAVCPFTESIWNLVNLVSKDVLDAPKVSTNSGKLNSYIIFDPRELLKNPLSIVGKFSK